MPAFKLDPEALSKLLIPYTGDKAYLHISVKSCALIYRSTYLKGIRIVVTCLSPLCKERLHLSFLYG